MFNAVILIDANPGDRVIFGDLVIHKHDFGVYSVNDGGLGDFKATVKAVEAFGYEVNFL